MSFRGIGKEHGSARRIFFVTAKAPGTRMDLALWGRINHISHDDSAGGIDVGVFPVEFDEPWAGKRLCP